MSSTATPKKMSLPQAAALGCLPEASPYLVPPKDPTWRLGVSLVSPTAHHILLWRPGVCVVSLIASHDSHQRLGVPQCLLMVIYTFPPPVPPVPVVSLTGCRYLPPAPGRLVMSLSLAICNSHLYPTPASSPSGASHSLAIPSTGAWASRSVSLNSHLYLTPVSSPCGVSHRLAIPSMAPGRPGVSLNAHRASASRSVSQ